MDPRKAEQPTNVADVSLDNTTTLISWEFDFCI